MSIKIFVTGTDTNVGKTYFCCALSNALQQLGYSTLAIKPISSGCIEINNKLFNDDALLLQQASSHQLSYEKINPFAYQPAIAPHIAAQQLNYHLTVEDLNNALYDAFHYPVDICIIEGVGGFYVPLNDHDTVADFVMKNHFPVILIVGIKLGCLNHAILTAKALQFDGISLLGWIANIIDDTMLACNDNISALKTHINAPCLGILSLNQVIETAMAKNIMQCIQTLIL